MGPGLVLLEISPGTDGRDGWHGDGVADRCSGEGARRQHPDHDDANLFLRR